MAIVDLPEKPPLDTAHAVRLRFSPEFLTELLRLPEGQEVTGARINAFGAIELLVEGAGLPEREVGADPVEGNLLFTQLRDPSGRSELQAYWEHAPDKRWLVRILDV